MSEYKPYSEYFEAEVVDGLKKAVSGIQTWNGLPKIMEAWILNLDEQQRSVDFVVLTEGIREPAPFLDVSSGLFRIAVSAEIEEAVKMDVRFLQVYPDELARSPYQEGAEETISIDMVAIRDAKAIRIL